MPVLDLRGSRFSSHAPPSRPAAAPHRRRASPPPRLSAAAPHRRRASPPPRLSAAASLRRRVSPPPRLSAAASLRRPPLRGRTRRPPTWAAIAVALGSTGPTPTTPPPTADYSTA